jgi:hypothetical protein
MKLTNEQAAYVTEHTRKVQGWTDDTLFHLAVDFIFDGGHADAWTRFVVESAFREEGYSGTELVRRMIVEIDELARACPTRPSG